MSGFQKRVAILEKWAPNLLPKLKDIDDLADIIYDVWLVAEADTEQRIIKLLEKEAAGFYFDRNFYAEITTNELIAKIKGEQK